MMFLPAGQARLALAQSVMTTNVDALNAAPIANAGGPYTVSENSPLEVSGEGSSDPDEGPLTYTWDLDNDGVFADAFGVTTTVTFSNGPATHAIGLQVTDVEGLTGTQTTTVAVNNVAPAVSTTGPYSAGEGTLISFTGVFTDPGSPAETYAFLWDFGDGYTSTLLSAGHAYSDNGFFSATFTTTDSDGGVGVAFTSVTITNVRPRLDITVTSPVSEGSFATMVGTATDPGIGDTLTYRYDCENDSTWDIGPIPSNTAQCLYLDGPATITVAVRVEDDDGGGDTVRKPITVLNIAPTADAGADQVVSEGQSVNFTGSGSDVPADPLIYEWDFEYGGAFTVDATGANVSRNYPDGPEMFTVALRVSDGDGGSTIDTLVVTVDNIPPTASASNNGPIDEGDVATITADRSDPSPLDTFQHRFDCDADGSFESGWQPSLLHMCPFADEGLFEVRVQVRDDDGGMSNIASTFVLVNNVAPAVSTTGPYVSQVGQTLSLTGIFTDPGTLDTHTFRWDFGDGITSTLQSPTHTYTANGVFTVTFTVRDSDGAIGSASTTVTIEDYHVFLPAVMRNYSGASGSGQASGASRDPAGRPREPGASTGVPSATLPHSLRPGTSQGSASSSEKTDKTRRG
jgi:PKD repeat protein